MRIPVPQQFETAEPAGERFWIEPAVVEVVLGHARVAHPNEVAGLLGADPTGGVVAAVELCTGTPDAVRVGREESARAAATLADDGLTCVGTYHSHTHRPAYPTRGDRMVLRPGRIMVIVSLRFHELRAFRLAPDGRGVAELRVEARGSRAVG